MSGVRHLLAGLGLAVTVAAGGACRDASARRGPPPGAPPASAAIKPAPPARGGISIEANPRISRGRRVAGWSPLRFSDPRTVNDGDRRTSWGAGKPTPAQPAWVALDLGKGPARVLLTWSAGGSFNYEETDYGSPGAYRIETSPDSTDGSDGAWKVVVSAPAVTTHAAAHSFDFAGQRWVKLVVTGAPAVSPNGVQIDEIDVHDVSAGVSDAWFFTGDSITAFAFGRPRAPGLDFAALVHGRHPHHDPVVINGGSGGEKSAEGLQHLDDRLAGNPDARFIGVGYGTNDAAGDGSDTRTFRANLDRLVARIQAAGRVPILATIPFAADGHHRNLPRFNDVIDELRRARSLPAGPDLYTWFSAHPEELRDGLHPDDQGIASINRLWADAVDALYAR
jgi:lysophospholipase L1-like esterase